MSHVDPQLDSPLPADFAKYIAERQEEVTRSVQMQVNYQQQQQQQQPQQQFSVAEAAAPPSRGIKETSIELWMQGS
jgi:hypothetical protein